MQSGVESDSSLVLQARDGDKDAFALLYRRHLPLLSAVCRRSVSDQSSIEDIMQEAALQALLNLDALRQPARFGPWLAGIGLNLCRRWRRERTQDVWSSEALTGGVYRHEPIDWRDGPDELAVTAELQALVQHAVAALPPGQRSAVLLFYLAGLTYVETAAHLGTSVDAIRTRLHKARARLQPQLRIIWEENHMTSEHAISPVPVRVADVRTKAGEDFEKHIVLLQEVDGARWLPIWIGPHEGTSLALLLEQVGMPRPLTPLFMANLLAAAGARVQQVRIMRLEQDTYYAEAVIEAGGATRSVDARPSDALILALATQAPIYVDAAVFAQASIHSNEEETAWLVEQPAHFGATAIVAKVRELAARRQEAARRSRGASRATPVDRPSA